MHHLAPIPNLALAAALLLSAAGCSDDDTPAPSDGPAAETSADARADAGPDLPPPDLGKLDIYNGTNFGARCTIPTPDAGHAAPPTVVYPGATDCDSKYCLYFSPMVATAKPICSGQCTVDAQCPQNKETCPGGFVCGLVTSLFDYVYPCCRMCLCTDFVASGSSPYDPESCAGVPSQCPAL